MDSNLVLDGDSITADPRWYYQPYLLLNANYGVANVAVGGSNSAQMVARAAATVDTLYRPKAVRNTIVVMIGTNDASAGITPAQTWANLMTYVQARHATGWEVIVATPIAPDQAAATIIRASWPGVFDGLADVGGDPNLGCSGCQHDTTYFQPDAVHPSVFSSQTIIAPIINAAINALG